LKGRVVILGGGGHAKVIIDILEQAGETEIAGLVSLSPQSICGYPWLGPDEVLADTLRSGIDSAFVAIGDNQRRLDCIDALKRTGFTLVNAISPAAVISRHATVACGVAVMPGAVINAGARLEEGAIVNTNASVDHDCIVGRCAHVAPGCSLAGWVKLGDGVFLGTGANVIPNISIGEWTTVGAGAAVVEDLPAQVVAMGVPARIRQ